MSENKIESGYIGSIVVDFISGESLLVEEATIAYYTIISFPIIEGYGIDGAIDIIINDVVSKITKINDDIIYAV
jgi:hypothetical protein